jgi:outer membrane usher protein FimD/PapC
MAYFVLQNLMSKGSKKKLEVKVTDKNGRTSTKTIYKWKRERAR